MHHLRVPTLLLKGEHDPITCEKQVEAYRQHVPHGRLVRFAHSGHWIRYEEHERYTETVLTFLREAVQE